MPRQPANRGPLDIRPLSFDIGFTRYAEGSVLARCGNTHVLCTVSIEEDLPKWLKGKGQGWITAEYSMLPRSTHTRTKRDREKVSGRTHEIQRLIGRALRATVDLKALGERSLMIDCDVLQADGGTRTTAINGAYIATSLALKKLITDGKIPQKTLINSVSAVSVGIKAGEVLVDLDYEEDSSCDVDMNFVITGSGQFIEVQGTAERGAFDWDQLQAMTRAAQSACREIAQRQASI